MDDHPEVLGLLETDLLTNGATPTGRKGLSVENILRCMLLKKITRVSYKMLAFHLADSHSYRTFAWLDGESYPDRSALSHDIRRMRPETLQKIFEHLAIKTFDDGWIDVELMRPGSTVVKSNIAPPLDSQLLNDGIRVLSRCIAKSCDRTGVKLRLTDYRDTSRALSAAIFYGKKAEKDVLYGELILLAKRVVKQIEMAIEQIQLKCHDETLSQPWIEEVTHFRDLLNIVFYQSERRVFNGDTVPPTEKTVSLFEPHTDIIVKGSREKAAALTGSPSNFAAPRHKCQYSNVPIIYFRVDLIRTDQ